ncbi:MAG TPA: DNA adenine methylase [Nitrososphaeraceae archaeon]|nr:DNA adenine methylase [Nitrososphaeraceae archaeon]
MRLSAKKEPVLFPLFLKWAGGKLQLIEQFENLFPHNFRNYYEPFVGSGAVFFYVKSKLKPNKVILSDSNEELINCFVVVRDRPSELVELLLNHRKRHSKEYYYAVRTIQPNILDSVDRAARFIYLNKTCFNGLYRVNSKGQFNVPFGDYVNPSIFDKNTLFQASQLLQDVHLQVSTFEKVLDFAGKDDFVYFDPPYIPLSKTSSFTRYSKSDFTMKEQKRLSEVFRILDSRGCFVMLSNSDHALTRELYGHYKKTTFVVKAKRMINSVGSKRGAINELIVTNYTTADKVETSLLSRISNF